MADVKVVTRVEISSKYCSENLCFLGESRPLTDTKYSTILLIIKSKKNLKKNKLKVTFRIFSDKLMLTELWAN